MLALIFLWHLTYNSANQSTFVLQISPSRSPYQTLAINLTSTIEVVVQHIWKAGLKNIEDSVALDVSRVRVTNSRFVDRHWSVA